MILLMCVGRPTRALKIGKPIEAVTEADIIEADIAAAERDDRP